MDYTLKLAAMDKNKGSKHGITQLLRLVGRKIA